MNGLPNFPVQLFPVAQKEQKFKENKVRREHKRLEQVVHQRWLSSCTTVSAPWTLKIKKYNGKYNQVCSIHTLTRIATQRTNNHTPSYIPCPTNWRIHAIICRAAEKTRAFWTLSKTAVEVTKNAAKRNDASAFTNVIQKFDRKQAQRENRIGEGRGRGKRGATPSIVYRQRVREQKRDSVK